MRISHITSNPKAKILYERLDILQTIDAALLRGNLTRQVEMVADELGQSNIPLTQFLEHLDGLQKQGIATFKLGTHNPHDPWRSTIVISKVNGRTLQRQMRKTQRELRKITGRTDLGGGFRGGLSKIPGTLSAINRVIVGFSTFLVAVGVIVSWKYWHSILQFLKHF